MLLLTDHSQQGGLAQTISTNKPVPSPIGECNIGTLYQHLLPVTDIKVLQIDMLAVNLAGGGLPRPILVGSWLNFLVLPILLFLEQLLRPLQLLAVVPPGLFIPSLQPDAVCSLLTLPSLLVNC